MEERLYQCINLLSETIKQSVEANKKSVESQIESFDKFYKAMFRVVISGIIAITILAGTIIYMTYQSYNYEGYPVPEIKNINENKNTNSNGGN